MPDAPAAGGAPAPAAAQPDLHAFNYCVSFIDLLGQRAVLKGEGLIPSPSSPEATERFLDTVKKSVGAIYRLQEVAANLVEPTLHPNPTSPLRLSLAPEQRPMWDEMMETVIKTQRWSDGLMSFVCISKAGGVRCPMNGVHGVILQAGLLCLIGLALKSPVRGGIEFAWGTEARPGELYGAALARAYELESEVAQYPRIVVGPNALTVIRHYAKSAGSDVFEQANRGMAQNCVSALARDNDGVWIVDYLGAAFRGAVPGSADFYGGARQFIHEQLAEHTESGDQKLIERYNALLGYFTR